MFRSLTDKKIFVEYPDDFRLKNMVNKFTKELNMLLDFDIDCYLKYTNFLFKSLINLHYLLRARFMRIFSYRGAILGRLTSWPIIIIS